MPLFEPESHLGRPDRRGSGRDKAISDVALVLVVVVLVAACAGPVPVPSPVIAPSPTLAATPTAAPTVTPEPTTSPSPSCLPGCATPAVFVRHGSRESKVVALTFDDGFNVPACISIVDTLLAKQVPATFFPNGQYVRENPGFWRWVAANGFPVGNHTTTHNDARTLSAEALGLSLESDRRIVDETLGLPSINAFRPPYGSYDLLVQEVAAAAGYPLLVGWDVDSQDQTGAPSVSAEIANATTGTNGSIVLMHCGSRLTPAALPTIIDRYRSRGFSFVTIPEMFDLPTQAAGWAPPPSPDTWPARELATNDVQPNWNASPAIDPAGHLHLAYESPTGIVYGDDTSGSWQSETIAPTTDATFASRPSIALAVNGGVHLVYLSSTTGGTELQYEERSISGVWSNAAPVAKLAAPASTATIAIDAGGQPVIAYTLLAGAHQGVMLAREAGGRWSSTPVPTTNGTFLNPSIAFDVQGSIHLIERRNGYPEIDETTNASGAWSTTRLLAVNGSAVPFAAYDPSSRLIVAAQQTYGSSLNIGTRSVDGSLTWTTVTSVGDLSGLAIGPDGGLHVAFSRIAKAGGPSRTWLAEGPGPTVTGLSPSASYPPP